MTRLKLRYAPFQQSIEPLYEIYDQFGETYGEPQPYEAAFKAMSIEQAFITARELEDYAVAGMLTGGC